MDRDKRWERVKIAVDGLCKAEATSETISVSSSDEAVAQVEAKYKEDITDEFLKPIVVGAEGRIKGLSYHSKSRSACELICDFTISDDDSLFFFNYRSDRMREIVSVFGTDPKPMEVTVPKNLVRPALSYFFQCKIQLNHASRSSSFGVQLWTFAFH